VTSTGPESPSPGVSSGCRRFRGRVHRQALLKEAERAGLFLIPLDEVRGWRRYHLAQALMAATSGHIEVVEPLLDAVEHAPPDWTDEPFEPTAGVAASHLINVPATTTLIRRYLAQLHSAAGATATFTARRARAAADSSSTAPLVECIAEFQETGLKR
jgi:hypothetical protein